MAERREPSVEAKTGELAPFRYIQLITVILRDVLFDMKKSEADRENCCQLMISLMTRPCGTTSCGRPKASRICVVDLIPSSR